jgi:hypothetical protein
MATEIDKIIFEIDVVDKDGVKSLDAIAASTRKLNQERRALDLTTVENQKKFDVLTDKINKNNTATKALGTNLEKQRLNVGNYTDSIKDAANQLNIAGVNVGELTEKISAGINPMALAAGGVSALVGLYVSSAAGARDLESAQTQLSTSFKVITNDLAKLVGADGKGGGILSSLAFELNRSLFGIQSAVLGSISAEAQQSLKQIELAQLDAQQYAKDQLALAEAQRRVRDDDSKTNKERLDAAKNISQFIIARESELVGVQEKRLDQLRILLATDKNNLEIQKEIKQTEFEIADIREDSAGKLTEALNGIKTVEKAIADQRAAERQKAIDDNAKITVNFEEEEAKRLEAILENQATRSEVTQEYLDQSLASTELELAAEDAKILKESEYTLALQTESQKRIAQKEAETEAERVGQIQRLQYVSNTISNLKALFKTASDGAKTAALVDIAVNTALGFVQGLDIAQKSAKATGPAAAFAFPAFYATQIASVLGAAKQAKDVLGFARGGLTGTRIGPGMGSPIRRSNGDDMLATVKTGEVILNQSQQARLGLAATFARIGVPGFASSGVTGGFETQAAASQVNTNRLFGEIRQAFAQMKIVLPLDDFEIKQETKVQIQTTAQVI